MIKKCRAFLNIGIKNFFYVLKQRNQKLIHQKSILKVKSSLSENVIPCEEDLFIVERLLAYYENMKDNFDIRTPGLIWKEISKSQHEFHDLISKRDITRLAEYFVNMSKYSITRGVLQGDQEYRKIKNNPLYRKRISEYNADKLLALAEGIGVLSIANPEQINVRNRQSIDYSELINMISMKIGHDIAPPRGADGGQFRNLIKLENGNQISIGERDCNAIYTAWYLMKMFSHEKNSLNACEIGAGVGKLAYWMTVFGVCSYDIIDLLDMNLVQGFYLIKSLGHERVQFFGEHEELGELNLRIYPSFYANSKVKKTIKKYDFVVNQDSFPEMNESEIEAYLDFIASCSSYLISINHENSPIARNGSKQLKLANFVEDRLDYVLESRNLYWIRRGYVLEKYSIPGTK